MLKKNVIFDLQQPQLSTIQEIKKLITSPPCLKYYDPNLPTRLKPDASSEGLGALLEQNHGTEDCEQWFPIAFASRALAPYEKNYAQIEKETLSIVFGTERFHEYLYGHHFTVFNDHQPLKSIFKKSITQCPPRIQRFFMKLQKYDFNLEYSPGKSMVVSDALSRAYLNNHSTEIDDVDLIHSVQFTFDTLPISEARLNQLQQETASDHILQQLKEVTLNGWPEKRSIPPSIKPYYSIRGEIVYHNGLLLKGSRIIIPSSLRNAMKEIIHHGHNGIERCKNRARQSVYWPGINHEIEDLVSRCSLCSAHRNKQQKEPLIEHEIPDAPWTKVASDLFTLCGHDYVIVTDYFSKFVEIERLPDKSSPTVINKIKKIFSRHGIPKELCTDNGPEYSAACFKRFTKEWDFKHTTSSPHFSQSNGFVERAIQTVKKSLLKAHHGNQDPYLALLILNTTPGHDDISPAMRLFGHQPRSTLPSLHPITANYPKKEKKTKVIKNYNQHARTLPDLQPGTVVRMRLPGDKRWNQMGKVIKKCAVPRSYLVLNEKGHEVRRNRRHLLPCKEKFNVQNNDDDLVEPTTQVIPQARHNTTSTTPNLVTRSGRIIRKPARYNN